MHPFIIKLGLVLAFCAGLALVLEIKLVREDRKHQDRIMTFQSEHDKIMWELEKELMKMR